VRTGILTGIFSLGKSVPKIGKKLSTRIVNISIREGKPNYGSNTVKLGREAERLEGSKALTKSSRIWRDSKYWHII